MSTVRNSRKSLVSIGLCLSMTLTPLISMAGDSQQANPAISLTGLSLASGKLVTTDGFTVPFKSLKGTEHQVSYVGMKSAAPTNLEVANVMTVYRQSGSEAGQWALQFGLAGLLGGVMGVNQDQGLGTPSGSTKLAIVGGMTVGMALIGLAFGSAKKTYTPAYQNPNF